MSDQIFTGCAEAMESVSAAWIPIADALLPAQEAIEVLVPKLLLGITEDTDGPS